MLSRFSFGRLAILASFAFFALWSSEAKAISVSYYSVVTFTGAGSNGAVLGNSGNLTAVTSTGSLGAVANDQLTYAGNTIRATGIINNNVPLSGIGSPTGVSFGTFFANSGDVDTGFDGASIRIDIFQTATNPLPPGGSVGTGQFIGSIDATLFSSPAFDTIQLTFTGATKIIIPNDGSPVGFPPHVIYSVDAGQTIAINTDGSFSIRGSVAAAPLPGVATAGLSMFGGLGGLTGLVAIRRRWLGVA